MRSETCPDHRIHVSGVDAVPAKQLEPANAEARATVEAGEGLGIGIFGAAIVVPERWSGEHHLYVRIVALPQLTRRDQEFYSPVQHRVDNVRFPPVADIRTEAIVLL